MVCVCDIPPSFPSLLLAKVPAICLRSFAFLGLWLMYSVCFPTLIRTVSVHAQTSPWQSWDVHAVSVDTLSGLLHPSEGWGQPASPQGILVTPCHQVPSFLLLAGFSPWPSLGTGSGGGRGARAGLEMSPHNSWRGGNVPFGKRRPSAALLEVGEGMRTCSFHSSSGTGSGG